MLLLIPYRTATTATLPCGTLSEAKEAFLQQYRDQYGYDGWMQQHWQAEVGNRIGQGQHYLDYTGWLTLRTADLR